MRPSCVYMCSTRAWRAAVDPARPCAARASPALVLIGARRRGATAPARGRESAPPGAGGGGRAWPGRRPPPRTPMPLASARLARLTGLSVTSSLCCLQVGSLLRSCGGAACACRCQVQVIAVARSALPLVTPGHVGCAPLRSMHGYLSSSTTVLGPRAREMREPVVAWPPSCRVQCRAGGTRPRGPTARSFSAGSLRLRSQPSVLPQR